MRKLSGKITITFALFYLILCSVVNADYPTEIKISAKQKNIKVGEPLIIKLTYMFEQPQFSPRADKIFKYIGPNATVQIKKGDEEILTQGYHLGPSDLYLQDTEGLKYSGDFLFFYDLFKNKLIFDTSGTYTIIIRRTRTKISNTLSIKVEPAKDTDKRALSLLSDPNDFFLLEFGETKDPSARRQGLLHLGRIFEQFKDTLLSKWAAARLGLEYFKDFHKKHTSFQKFKTELKESKVKEPLFDQAHKYLSAGFALPDEFPVREQVLYELSVTEYIKDNYKKAFSLLDELGSKYPTGKYGKKASSGKAELQELQERELGQSTNPPLGQSQGRIAVTVVVVTVAAGIVLIVLFCILKKRTTSPGK